MTATAPMRPHDPPEAERLLLIFSDIEMGAGGNIDDFPHSDFLADLILSYNRPPYDRLAIDLIFNGDTFDLLKTSYFDKHPRHITRDVALGKMMRIAAAHPRFFEGVRRFLDYEGADRRVYFVVGNHDAEIIFEEVQQLIRSLCGGSERVTFPGFELSYPRIRVEHGSQHDRLFRMEPDELIVDYQGDQVLNIAWGSVALLDTFMDLQPLLGFHDRCKPRDTVFDLMPELKEFVMGTGWRYYTRDYWSGFFSKDPTKKLSWGMVKEIIWRFGSGYADVEMEKTLQKRLEEEDDIVLYVLGHQHQPACWSVGDRKILQSACFRNEYMVADEGRRLRPIAKGYVEVYVRDEFPLRSELVEIEGPPAPSGYIPESFFDVLPELREILALREDREEHQEAQRKQEELEAEEEDRPSYEVG